MQVSIKINLCNKNKSMQVSIYLSSIISMIQTTQENVFSESKFSWPINIMTKAPSSMYVHVYMLNSMV